MNETFVRNVTRILTRIAILCVAFLCFRTYADIRNRTYEWKSGSWNTCFSPNKCGEGQKDRKVWCIDSVGLIVPDSNCNSSSKPSTTDACFRVCENHKRNLRWKVDQWTPCVPSHNAHHLPRLHHPSKCQVTFGVTKRNVSCIFEPENSIIYGNKTVDSSACEFFWDRPEDTMPCSMDCPQDCVVAQPDLPFNESYECDNIFAVKRVIVAPHSGGRSCPELTVITSNNYSLSNSCLRRRTDQEFFLKVGAWGVCQPPDAINAKSYSIPSDTDNYFSSTIGLRRRNVTCVNSLGEKVDLGECEKGKKVAPYREQLCVVPRSCEVSPWSEWRVIKEGCMNSEGHIFPELRTRKRRLQYISIGEDVLPCPPLWESVLIVDELPPCYKYKWVPTEWGECVVFEHPTVGQVRTLRPTCGGGVQQRNITCLRVADLVPVEPEYCKEPLPVTIQRCTIPCKRDCQLSHWSKWGPCLPVNVTDYFQKIDSGFIKRERSIVVDPTPDGKPCGHLYESDTCRDLEIFSWHYNKWSDCMLPNPQDLCGDGKKTRDYTCVESKGETLSDFMCVHHATIAETTKSCTVPCPDDCVLSEWSEWSPCSKPCSAGRPAHHIGGKTRNRTLLAIPGPAGKPCPRRTNSSNVCNDQSCQVIKWTTSDWEPCVLPEDRTCGDGGTQMRKVFCSRGNDRYKPYKLCRSMPKPENERSCSVPCPMDCVLTKFSEWSHCPSSCDSDVVQTREQYVLLEAKHGGKPCPLGLKEERPCSVKTELLCLKKKSRDLDSFRWNVGPWSECILQFPRQQCGTGLQIRSVTCMDDDDDREVEFHHCLDNLTGTDTGTRSIADLMSLVPKVSRACDVLCGPICSVSEWSPWSHCGDSYNAHRWRTRELLGPSDVTEICKASVPLEEKEPCPPMPISVPKGDHFMSCIVTNINRTFAAVNGQLQHICGSGFRYKAGFDMDQGFVLKPGLEKEICIVDCPVDCQMSEWSQWSPCNAPCGAGFRYRHRNVIVHANKLGKPCPDVEKETEVQTDACNIPCADYQWWAGGWTECELFDPNLQLQCGNGTHYRTVKCVEKRTIEEVDPVRCDPQLRPPTSEPCQVFCPGECVVSTWSPWVDCSEPCNSENRRLRRRIVLRHPSYNSSHTCPSLIKEEPCVLNETCFHHAFSLGEWSSCILEDGAVCGEGVQRRPLLCIRSDGRQVDHIMCEKRHQSPSLREPISKPCYIDCPIDCILSSWSPWDESKCSSCGDLGLMSRYRTILQPQSEAGQPCSPDLIQKNPCDFRPCYHWKVTDWSPCDLQGADCGHGLRRRDVRCERYDGLEVGKIHCLIVNLTFDMKAWIDPQWLTVALDKQEEEPCHVECPGDCFVTQWSQWSHCNRDCAAGRAYGYSTSSRAILDGPSSEEGEKCPNTLWRTRPCWDEYCYTFSWKILNDTIVCLRSDGLIVEGGCGDKPRPCSRPCGEKSVLCDAASGDCLCESGRTRLPLPGGAQGSSTNLIRCSMLNRMGHPQRPANHTAFTPEIRLMYFPDDNQASFWMYAMISIGTAFIIFVFVTVYLMCRSSIRRRMVSVQRQASVRRRSPETVQSPCQC